MSTAINKATLAFTTINDNFAYLDNRIDDIGGGASYSATCPAITPVDGVATWVVTHNLGTQAVVTALYSNNNKVEHNTLITSNNVLTVTFKASSAVSAGSYKIVVLASGGTPSSGSSSYKIHNARGLIVNGGSDIIQGVGFATVKLQNGRAEINYSYKITQVGTANTFNWGLNPNLLHERNSSIPIITPLDGGTAIFYTPSGIVYTQYYDYAGCSAAASGFWIPARIYTTAGDIGFRSSKEFSQGTIITGMAYGTYEV